MKINVLNKQGDAYMTKNPTIRPWRVSFFQKQNDFDKLIYERFSDLYLARTTYKDNIIGYQIKNDQKELILDSKLYLNHGILEEIELYSPEDYNRSLLNVRKDSTEYVFLKDEVFIGKLQILKDRLCFLDVDSEVVYSAILVSGDNSCQPLDLMKIPDWYYKFELQFIFRGKSKRSFGKYFIALRNLDLTTDKKVRLNRHIAVTFAIVINETFLTSIKPIKPHFPGGII
jgi:hypothetical protein